MKLLRVRHASADMGKGRFASISSKCREIIPLSKEYFPLLYVEPFGYNKSANDSTVKFLAKFGAISPSPRK